MQSKEIPVRKQEPPPGPGLNLLKPFSKEDFPKLAQKQKGRPPFYGAK